MAQTALAVPRQRAVTVCVPILDPRVVRRLAPGAATPRERLDEIRRLSGAGVPCGLAIDPVLPGVNDRLRQLRRLVSAGARAGARWVTARGVRLSGEEGEGILSAMALWRPALARRYRSRFGPAGEPPRLWEDRLQRMVASLRVEFGLAPGPREALGRESTRLQLHLPFRADAGANEYPEGRAGARLIAVAG